MGSIVAQLEIHPQIRVMVKKSNLHERFLPNDLVYLAIKGEVFVLTLELIWSLTLLEDIYMSKETKNEWTELPTTLKLDPEQESAMSV